MASIWKGLCSVAVTAFNNVGPVLGTIAGESLKKVGNDLTGQNSKQASAELNSREKQLKEHISSMEKKIQAHEKEFQSRKNNFSEKQRKLDATEERLLREQESLKMAEAELKNRQKRTGNTQEIVERKHNNNVGKPVAEVRECLYEELTSYEKDKNKLIKQQNECLRDYEEGRQGLKEAHKTLKQNLSQIIHLLKSLPAIQKIKELQALTDVFMHNCEVFAEDPDAMVDETRIMQRKYTIKLMEVRNVMLDGHLFPGSMRVWADGAVLDLHMLGFLVAKDVFSYKAVEHAKDKYQGYWDNLKVFHTSHRAVTKGSDRLQEIEFSLETQFRNFDTLMIKSMPSGRLPSALGLPREDVFQSSSNRAFGATGDQFGRSRHSQPVRERGPCRRPLSPAREMVRRGDADPSWVDDRLLIVEQKLAALEKDGRYDGPGNDFGAAGDQFGRSRHSQPVRGRGPCLHLSSPARELVRRGDADPSWDDDRLLIVEQKLVALEKDGRYDGPGDDFGATGDQFGRSRHSQPVRERGPCRRPSSPERELVRRGDAGHSWDDDRLLIVEQKLVALAKDGRYDGPGNDFGAAGDQFGRSRRSQQPSGAAVVPRPLIGSWPCRRPSSPDRELVRRGDANPSWDDNRLLFLEQKLAALEWDGRYDGPGNDAWDLSEQQHKASRSSSRKLAVVSSSGGSANNRESTLEHERRETKRSSQYHQEYATGFCSSQKKREPELNGRERMISDDQRDFLGSRYSFRDQQEYHGGRDGPENRQPSRQKYQARSHSSNDQQESSDESGSSSDDQGTQYESKGKSPFPKINGETSRNVQRRNFSNNQHVNQQSDDSEGDNYTRRNTTTILHKSGGNHHYDRHLQVNEDRGNLSVDRQGQERHHSSTKKKTKQKKKHYGS